MNLDDPKIFETAAQRQVLAEIDALADGLLDGFAAGKRLALDMLDAPHCVIISGTGNSAIGADLLAGYVSSLCPVPVVIVHDYGLPAFAKGPHSLVILSSYSGETQETLSGLAAALQANCRIVALCTGGRLAEETAKAGGQVWKIDGRPSARASTAYSFGLLLAVFQRLGLIPEQHESLQGAVETLRAQGDTLCPTSPVSQNMAKRMAGQLMGRLVTVFAAGAFVPVAHHWKSQINQLAKSIAQCEALPEADYCTLQGASMPEAVLLHSMALFLRAEADQRQNRLRSNRLRQALLLEGINTDFVDARGDSLLAQLWSLTQMGEYMAFYLAAAYGIDPTPLPPREDPQPSNPDGQSSR